MVSIYFVCRFFYFVLFRGGTKGQEGVEGSGGVEGRRAGGRERSRVEERARHGRSVCYLVHQFISIVFSASVGGTLFCSVLSNSCDLRFTSLVPLTMMWRRSIRDIAFLCQSPPMQ